MSEKKDQKKKLWRKNKLMNDEHKLVNKKIMMKNEEIE